MLTYFLAFNANGIWRRPCELSRELQELSVDLAVLSEACLEIHKKVTFFQIITFIAPTTFRAEKAKLLLQLKRTSHISV
jgi:hypothetical protein